MSKKQSDWLSKKLMSYKGNGKTEINYRLRDAVFSRQRYWGEPFPIYYKDDIPNALNDDDYVTLPPIDKYLPTEKENLH